MTPFAHRSIVLAQVMTVVLALAGCGRGDTRVNSDPGPGRPSRADGGDKAVRPDPNQVSPAHAGTGATSGSEAVGRPTDASGGTTEAGAGSSARVPAAGKGETAPLK